MNDSVIVVGAGGHAKVCIELLQAAGRRVAFCIGQSPSTHCVGVPVLAGDEHLARLRQQGYDRVFIAVGANALRRRLAAAAQALGYQLVNAISPQAVISPSARLGSGVAIMAGAVVNAEAEIGDLVIINTGATVDHDCRLGPAVHIAPQCGLAGSVSIGAETFLGVGCKVIPGVRIGDNVLIGAGGVVIDDIPAQTRAVGVPARPLSPRSSN